MGEPQIDVAAAADRAKVVLEWISLRTAVAAVALGMTALAAYAEQGWWTTQGDIASCEPLPAGGGPLVAVEQLQSQGENPRVHTERDSAGHITVLITVAWRPDVEAGRHVASQFYFFSDYGTCQERLQALIDAGLLKAPSKR
jgi:hypothetical protein